MSAHSNLVYDDFTQFTSFKDVREEYGRRSIVFKTKWDLIERTLIDWQDACWAELNLDEVKSRKPVLDEILIECDGLKIYVSEAAHSITGGGTKEYRDFIKEQIKNRKPLMFEKTMQYMYAPNKNYHIIPDFDVLRFLDVFSIGFQMTINPLRIIGSMSEFLIESMREKPPGPKETGFLENLHMSPYYHNVDPMVRRGLGSFLPPALQSEYSFDIYHDKWRYFLSKNQMKVTSTSGPLWVKWRRYHILNRFMAISPRSAYMIEFVKRYCKTNFIDEIHVIVGETHNTDMLYHANNPCKDEYILKLAEQTGSLQKKDLEYYFFRKTPAYLASGMMGAVAGLSPYALMASMII